MHAGGGWLYLFFAEKLIPLSGPATLDHILALILSMVLVESLGAAVERFLFRPFLGNPEAAIIVSFCVMLILQAAALVTFGIRDKPLRSPFSGNINFLSISLSGERLAVVICGIVLIIAMYLFIERTKTEKAMRAVAQDMEVASVGCSEYSRNGI